MFSRLLNRVTHKIYSLPVLVLMPHSACNCKCVMCDIWKANHQKREITQEDLVHHIAGFRKLKVKEVVLSGGEPLMHSNLWKFCEELRKARIKVTLLTTGLLLGRFAHDVARSIDDVIISLDGSREIHNQIRGVLTAYDKMAEGAKALRVLKPDMKISARTVIQRFNFFDFIPIINSARQLGMDRISFLGADISSTAFNRREPWSQERISDVALDKEEALEFEKIVTDSFASHAADYASAFIAERPEKMLRIVQYYKAVNGLSDFPKVECNAPWVSAVMESNGDIHPCFFHEPYGNVAGRSLPDVLNSSEAVAFRRNLNVRKNPVCQKCVCTLKLSLLPSLPARA
jgi:MoaA/NifB/PqqE/SkfB family radical SAM enzyme